MVVKIKTNIIKKVQIYINKSKKTMSTIIKETGADYAINGWIYNADWTPCPLVKVDGKWVSEVPYGDWGYGFNTGSDIQITSDKDKFSNFMSGVCFANPYDGNSFSMNYQPDMGGSRQRTAIGMTADNELVLYCSQSGATPEQLRATMLGYGCVSGIMLDGGGSSQCDFGSIGKLYSSRVVQNLILIYLNKENGNADLREKYVTVAEGELGVSEPDGDDKYINWYSQETGVKFSTTSHWCNMYTTWCARQAGIGSDMIPTSASCTTTMNWYKQKGLWRNKDGYTPRRGDNILFNWYGQTSIANHIGIVKKVSGNYVYSIEGNTSAGDVRIKSYPLTSSYILGYGDWDGTGVLEESDISMVQRKLNEKFGYNIAVDGSWGPDSKKHMIMAVQTSLNKCYGKKLDIDGSYGPASKSATPDMYSVTVNDFAWCVQACLIVRGYDIDLDGSYGPASKRACVSFQKSVGITANGVVGPVTMTYLLK